MMMKKKNKKKMNMMMMNVGTSEVNLIWDIVDGVIDDEEDLPCEEVNVIQTRSKGPPASTSTPSPTIPSKKTLPQDKPVIRDFSGIRST
jgi:hypothetical protein